LESLYEDLIMLNFKLWLENISTHSIYYHGTSVEAAQSILQNGVDPKRYKSGMFQGFYLSPRKPDRYPAVLEFMIDNSKIMDKDNVSEKDLAEVDPHFRSMSYGYRNSLITKIAVQKGYGGIRNGAEIILIDKSPIVSVQPSRD